MKQAHYVYRFEQDLMAEYHGVECDAGGVVLPHCLVKLIPIPGDYVEINKTLRLICPYYTAPGKFHGVDAITPLDHAQQYPAAPIVWRDGMPFIQPQT